MGYKCYLKSYSNNYLEQKRIKNLDESTYLYVKGDFEPIIQRKFLSVARKSAKAEQPKWSSTKVSEPTEKGFTRCMVAEAPLCLRLYFPKNKWRTNQRGDTVFGYQCYNQVNNGSKSFREKNGLDTDGYCDIRMIGDWKLDLMAKKILKVYGRIKRRRYGSLQIARRVLSIRYKQ